jgi:peroxiredoxin
VSGRLREFDEASVVLITFTRQRNLHAFRRLLGLSYPVLADETRAVYHSYGLVRGPWWRIWSWRTLRAIVRLRRAGHRIHRPTEDTRQLGGDFVIDRGGRVAYAYRSRRPDDRPAVDDLVAAVGAAP